MQDLQSALDKADGKAPGPNHVEARFIKALPAPVQWLLVHTYRAILRGASPPMHWRDAQFWLSPKVPGSARLDDYRPIALGQLDMKLLTGPLTQHITEVLTRHGEAGSEPCGHLGVTWGVYLCAGKPPLADIILSHPPDLTRCDSVIGLAIPAMSGHIQYRGTASGDLYIGISGINRVLLS